MPQQNNVWTAAYGRRMYVHDMEDSHIVNAIAVTQKHAAERLSFELIHAALSLHDEDCIPDLFADGFEAFVPPVYFALCAEARKRELIFSKQPEEPDRPCDMIKDRSWELEEE